MYIYKCMCCVKYYGNACLYRLLPLVCYFVANPSDHGGYMHLSALQKTLEC